MRTFLLASVLAALAAMLAVSPIVAAPGVSVGLAGGPGRMPEVLPGEAYKQGLVMTAGDVETDLLVEVLGYGQDPQGGIIPLTAAEDVGAYSGRTFLSPAATTVHLKPGETRRVELNVTIPENVGDGGRYALLRFSTGPSGEGTVGVVSAIVLPFKFTIKGSRLVHSGSITSVAVPAPESGKPITAMINYENTGNHHYKLTGQVRIRDSHGTLIANSEISAYSPIPGCATQVPANIIPDAPVAPGLYSADVTLSIEDGTVLDAASCQFEMSTEYVAPLSHDPSAVDTTQPTQASPSQHGSSNATAMIAMVAGAFIVGSVGTFLATRRRRPR